ncbi:hypothetical protein TrLO_g6332 [Triparma laevis f. longispina]|uniref:Mitochondrial carrier n=2 Tax=Triparma laevis TaxID=1534972 RepID=A0A9W7CCX1_9STRA|nr:hypothetical protein TrLO_g6332 [Triparma laevis f. longispina]
MATNNAAPAKPHIELFAGTFAGTFGIVPFYPLDTLKSRLQTTSPSTPPLRILTNMIQQEGLTSLYRGCLSPMLGYGLINGSVFLSRSFTRNLIAPSNRPLTFPEEIIVGASAGFWSSFIRAPVERIKSVMQVKTLEGVNSPYSSSLSCARTLVKDLGVIKGLYKGFGSTVIREVPQYIFYFVGYDNLKRTLQTDTSTPSDLVPVIAGGVSGVLIWMPPFYSFDVIKTRLQVERFSNGGVPEYKGFWDCVRKSYRREGVGVFWRGAGLAQARAFGVHGSIFFLYEKCMDFMEEHFIGAEPRGGGAIQIQVD